MLNKTNNLIFVGGGEVNPIKTESGDRRYIMPNHPYKSTTHKEKFFHFTDIPNTDYRAFTVFCREEHGRWESSVAICSIDDQFQRRIGRQVARRRFFEEPTIRLNHDGEPGYDEIRQAITDAYTIPPEERDTGTSAGL